MLIDSHAHLDFLEDLDAVLARAKGAGVTKIVTIGTSVECSSKCIELAEKYSDSDLAIYATCGIHPEDGKGDIEKYGSILKVIDELTKLAKSSNRVVGIGECGLDYYLETGDKQSFSANKQKATSEKEKEFQRGLFAGQIKLAADLDLPLVVHCRNGWDEIFDLVKSANGSGSDPVEGATLKRPTGVFHSWTGNWQAARKALDLGFYISFSGIVTFKNAPLIQEVAGKVQTDRILLETDSPFLAPEPLRSEYYRSNKQNPTSLKLRGAHMRNEPENVKIIAGFLAEIRKTNLAAIGEETSKNAQKLFKLW